MAEIENKAEKPKIDVVEDKRKIKTFVLRSGRVTASDKKNLSELSGQWCIPYGKDLVDYRKVFENENPVTIEIGFGMGKATWMIAEANPEKNYLGLEVHQPGVGRLLGEIKNHNLKNLRICAHDAVEVLENMIPDESVDAFHIFFADPWPKKKHHKRRFVQRPRTDLLAKKLKKGGYLYFVTDWLPYAEFAMEELNLTEGLENKFPENEGGYAPHQEWRPETRFEQKGLDANRVISELFFIKK